MLTRVQRELVTVHPLSLYKKQIKVDSNYNPQGLTTNGLYDNNQEVGQQSMASMNAKQKIEKIINEVNEKREMRERKESDLKDEELADDLETLEFDNPEMIIKTKYYKEKLNVYNFLNKPIGFWARSYHVLVFILVFAGFIVTVFSNINKFATGAWKFIYLFEKVIILWFGSEFLLRLWSSSCKQQYQGWKGKIKYLLVPAHILDLIIIFSSIIIVIPIQTRNGSEVFAVSAFRGFHRFFCVLQIITLNRQLQPWKVLSSVIYDQREQLIIIFYIEFIVLCILAYISYIVEKDDNDQFDNIAEAMWWSVVTLSTVGYGDRIPLTWLGKLISSVFTILGVAIFALPAGIIGAGLALKIEEEERNRQRRKKKIAAANFIKSTWRCYKADCVYAEYSKFFQHKPMDIYKIQDYENIAKKFIYLTKFFIARNKFRDFLRPIDIKTIIESYKYGQMDVMSRVNHMQNTIDIIGTRIGLSENTLQSSQTAMTSKLDNIEYMIHDIENTIEKQSLIVNSFLSNPIFNKKFLNILNDMSKNGIKIIKSENKRKSL